jgi:hypothetical protein
VFTVAKCPVCRENVRKQAEDYLFMTVREGSVVRADRGLLTNRPDGDRVFEVHERCAGAFAPAPPM